MWVLTVHVCAFKWVKAEARDIRHCINFACKLNLQNVVRSGGGGDSLQNSDALRYLVNIHNTMYTTSVNKKCVLKKKTF